MPRHPRFYYPGAVLHVVQRGNNRAPVFTCVGDRRFYLACLLRASRAHSVAIHAYVLMSNHVHLLASPGHERGLPRMMQALGRRYVSAFNRAYERTGTLWDGRYKATLVDTQAYLFTCLRYIEENPVRAAIVESPADYRWSSHRANAFGARDPIVTPHPLLAALAATDEERRSIYRDMFGRPAPDASIQAIRDATQFEWALGRRAFRDHAEALTGRRAARIPKGRPRKNGEQQ